MRNIKREKREREGVCKGQFFAVTLKVFVNKTLPTQELNLLSLIPPPNHS